MDQLAETMNKPLLPSCLRALRGRNPVWESVYLICGPDSPNGTIFLLFGLLDDQSDKVELRVHTEITSISRGNYTI